MSRTLCVHDVWVWIYSWQQDKVASVLSGVQPPTETRDQSAQHWTTGHWLTLRVCVCVCVCVCVIKRSSMHAKKCSKPLLLSLLAKWAFKFKYDADWRILKSLLTLYHSSLIPSQAGYWQGLQDTIYHDTLRYTVSCNILPYSTYFTQTVKTSWLKAI